MIYVSDPSTQETEGEKSRVQDQQGLHSETLCQTEVGWSSSSVVKHCANVRTGVWSLRAHVKGRKAWCSLESLPSGGK